jgi:hypothetical protein
MRRNPKSSITSTLTLEVLIAQGPTRAFDTVRTEILAVPAEALHPVNLAVPRAARRGLVVAERVEPLFPELSTMSHLDFPKVQRLPVYALALLYAHERAEVPDDRAGLLAELLAQAVPLRADLLYTAEMLGHFGLVSSERVAFIRSGQGHADTAADLQALGVLLGDAWPSIKDKVAITREQVDRAIPLSARLQRAIGVREANADPLAERTDPRHVRAQAFTLFMGAYDECRRGVSHLRWHEGDAAEIVPSLYPRRGVRPKSAEEDVANDLVDTGLASDQEVELAPRPMPELRAVAEPPQTRRDRGIRSGSREVDRRASGAPRAIAAPLVRGVSGYAPMQRLSIAYSPLQYLPSLGQSVPLSSM